MCLELIVIETYSSGMQAHDVILTNIQTVGSARLFCAELQAKLEERIQQGITICYSIFSNAEVGLQW